MTKKKMSPFVRGMMIYAVIFLVVIAVGLTVFWQYIDAYEQSRPGNITSGYVQSLTPERICELSQDLIDRIDHDIQSVAECRACILESLGDQFTCAKKSSESTDDRMVYVLRDGARVIGQFVITASSTDTFGFAQWEVTEESMDLSFLLKEGKTITVPEEFTVCVNGCQLGSNYVTERGIPYSLLEEYYESYDLPSMVTYHPGIFLGELDVTVLDSEGNPVIIDEETDMNRFADNCSEAEIQKIDAFLPVFLRRYVAYTGGSNGDYQGNYSRLMSYVVSGSDLAVRLKKALDGMMFTKSNGDTVTSVTVHHYIKLDESTYLCDATYLVNTRGHEGTVETTNNVRLIIRKTSGGLKTASMTGY